MAVLSLLHPEGDLTSFGTVADGIISLEKNLFEVSIVYHNMQYMTAANVHNLRHNYSQRIIKD